MGVETSACGGDKVRERRMEKYLTLVEIKYSKMWWRVTNIEPKLRKQTSHLGQNINSFQAHP
jgi:hypothetical protein